MHRVYENADTGDQITLAVLVGPPGPIAVHTPEVCYSSQNTTIVTRNKVEVATDTGGDASTFWATVLKPNSLEAQPFRVFYAWSTDGKTWIADDNPRFNFGGAGILYKLQLVADDYLHDDGSDPAVSFLKELAR